VSALLLIGLGVVLDEMALSLISASIAVLVGLSVCLSGLFPRKVGDALPAFVILGGIVTVCAAMVVGA
jgi:hypothetical protein